MIIIIGRVAATDWWFDEKFLPEPDYSYTDYENYRYDTGLVEEVGNIYHREYAQDFCEGEKAYGIDKSISLIRCTWVESHRYGAFCPVMRPRTVSVDCLKGWRGAGGLPSGRSTMDARTYREVYDGGQTVTAEGPIDSIPVFPGKEDGRIWSKRSVRV